MLLVHADLAVVDEGDEGLHVARHRPVDDDERGLAGGHVREEASEMGRGGGKHEAVEVPSSAWGRAGELNSKSIPLRNRIYQILNHYEIYCLQDENTIHY